LSFVPVDFERQSWAEEIAKTGFDRRRPAVVSSLGDELHQCRRDSVQLMLHDVARLAPGSGFVCGFALPAHLIEPDEREMRAEIAACAAARGHPWVSFFSHDAIRGLAEGAGFSEVSVVTADDLAGRYVAGREDGLRPNSAAYLIASV
jgi:O-methyltransferase involved in polyketide biosynthesis